MKIVSTVEPALPSGFPVGFSISLCFMALAVLVPFSIIGLSLTAASALAVGALATPFVILLAGHHYLCHSWQRHLAVSILNLPVGLAWSMAIAIMWYFQPGLYGALLLGFLLSFLASLGLLLARLVREASAA
jgi:hypothetical protein